MGGGGVGSGQLCVLRTAGPGAVRTVVLGGPGTRRRVWPGALAVAGSALQLSRLGFAVAGPAFFVSLEIPTPSSSLNDNCLSEV